MRQSVTIPAADEEVQVKLTGFTVIVEHSKQYDPTNAPFLAFDSGNDQLPIYPKASYQNSGEYFQNIIVTGTEASEGDVIYLVSVDECVSSKIPLKQSSDNNDEVVILTDSVIDFSAGQVGFNFVTAVPAGRWSIEAVQVTFNADTAVEPPDEVTCEILTQGVTVVSTESLVKVALPFEEFAQYSILFGRGLSTQLYDTDDPTAGIFTAQVSIPLIIVKAQQGSNPPFSVTDIRVENSEGGEIVEAGCSVKLKKYGGSLERF